MLLDLLSEYLNAIESLIQKLKNVYVERYEEEIIDIHKPTIFKVIKEADKYFVMK